MEFRAEYKSEIASGAKADADAVARLRAEMAKASGAVDAMAASGARASRAASVGQTAVAQRSLWAGPLRVQQSVPELYRATGALKKEQEAAAARKREEARQASRAKMAGAAGTVAGGARMAVGAALAAGGVAGAASLAQLALGYQGVARMQALVMRTQLQVRQMFARVDSGPATRAVDRFLGSIFSRSSVAGRALGEALGRNAQSFFNMLERAQPYATAFFQGIIWGGLQAENAFLRARLALLPYTSALERAIGPTNGVNAAAAAGLVTFGALAVVVGGVAGAFTAAAAAIGAAYAQLEKLKKEWGSWKEGAGLVGKQLRRDLGLLRPEDEAAAADDKTRRGFSSVDEQTAARRRRDEWQKANGLGASAGQAYADGVVKGTSGGAAAAASAGGALADAVDKGFRNKAQIKSPSKVGERRGEMIPAGVARGVAKGAPEVERAGAAMMPSLVGAPAGAPALAGGARVVHLDVRVQVDGARAQDEASMVSIARRTFSEEARAMFQALGFSVELATG